MLKKVAKAIREAIQEDEADVIRKQKQDMNMEILKEELCKETKSLYYQGNFKEVIAERMKIPRDQRKAEKLQGDEVDAVDTTDLENW